MQKRSHLICLKWCAIILAFFVCVVGLPKYVEAKKNTKVSTKKTASVKKKSAKTAKRPYQVSARSAILLTESKKKLYQKNVSLPVPPASTTKVMTALLVLENLDLNKTISVHSSATHPPPSKINLKPGETFAVKDLLYALLLNSANDVSVALAQAVAGSEKEFVVKMNERARQLGARNTKFVNSNGLPSPGVKQYTTAYDMSLIFKKALQHEFFKKAISHRHKVIYSAQGRKVYLKNHNRMLFTDWGNTIHGKTGYTRAARACFVGVIPRRGKEDLIVAVFGCQRRWNDIRHIVRKYGGVLS